MRREGFELQLGRPEVIYRDIDGVMMEPFESVQIDTPEQYTGTVIDAMSQRKGEMQNMENEGNGQTRLTFLAPSRGLIGYSTEFLSATGGYGITNHTFENTLRLSRIGNQAVPQRCFGFHQRWFSNDVQSAIR